MNIVFLDIDGVLNGNSYLTGILMKFRLEWLLRFVERLTHEVYGVHENKVKRLAKIIKATNAKVVLTSSWRYDYLEYIDASPIDKILYYNRKIAALYHLFIKYNIDVIGVTPPSDNINGKRQDEIILWLAHNEDKVDNYVILDDEWSHLEAFQDSKLVITCDSTPTRPIHGRWYCREGLRDEHVDKAIKILNNE